MHHFARFRWLAPFCCLLAWAGCGEGADEFAPSSRAEIEARYPDAERLSSQWRFVNNGTPFFPFLEGEGSLIGEGWSVPVGAPREDRSRALHRVGRWAYRYGDHTDTGPPLGIGACEAHRCVGPWRFWHENGQPWAEGSFVAGKMQGPWQFWTSDGKVDAARTGLYEANVRVGALPAKR